MPTTQKPSYDDADACLALMQRDTQRQFAKDQLFLKMVSRYLRPGSTLEIGAGIGQIAGLLKASGFDVLASDIQPWMVDYMRSIGLDAQIVDCLRIVTITGRRFNNIIAQGPSPFVTSDLEMVAAAYRSVYEGLAEGGRFIFVFPDFGKRPGFSRITDHWPIIRKTGFATITSFRHQIFPSRAYAFMPRLLHDLFENTIGRFFGIRHILILERPH